jgi:polyvinyl alcohol dehydrogenase (cytochrome)
MLHLSRQRRRAGYCDGQADLEELHYPEAPRPTKQNAVGTQLYGPSGAAVWSSPTIDVQRQALYVATGDNYSDPPSETSDAILAFELATGRMLWHRQATANDSYITSCLSADRTNCPESNGPDHDFGQSPILVSLRSGQRVLVVGQKSGVVHALDPDQEGKILWQTGSAKVVHWEGSCGALPQIRTMCTSRTPTYGLMVTKL